MAEGEPKLGPEDVREIEDSEAVNEVTHSQSDLYKAENAENVEKQKSPEEVEHQKRLNRLIERAETYPFESSVAGLFQETYFSNIECQKLVDDKLKGRRLIDLGCGEYGLLSVPAVASHAGASEYIGVEKYHDPDFTYVKPNGKYMYIRDSRDIPSGAKVVGETLRRKWKRSDLQDIEIRYKKEDMLKYLSGLENESANIVINGVDEYIIPLPVNVDYIEALLNEIIRVIGNSGVVMSYETPFVYKLEEMGFEIRKFGSGLNVFLKSVKRKNDQRRSQEKN